MFVGMEGCRLVVGFDVELGRKWKGGFSLAFVLVAFHPGSGDLSRKLVGGVSDERDKMAVGMKSFGVVVETLVVEAGEAFEEAFGVSVGRAVGWKEFVKIIEDMEYKTEERTEAVSFGAEGGWGEAENGAMGCGYASAVGKGEAPTEGCGVGGDGTVAGSNEASCADNGGDEVLWGNQEVEGVEEWSFPVREGDEVSIEVGDVDVVVWGETWGEAVLSEGSRFGAWNRLGMKVGVLTDGCVGGDGSDCVVGAVGGEFHVEGWIMVRVEREVAAEGCAGEKPSSEWLAEFEVSVTEKAECSAPVFPYPVGGTLLVDWKVAAFAAGRVVADAFGKMWVDVGASCIGHVGDCRDVEVKAAVLDIADVFWGVFVAAEDDVHNMLIVFAGGWIYAVVCKSETKV